jgi:hypothetical protein
MENDGTYPAGSEVWVQYPVTFTEIHGPRADWPWMAGRIVAQTGPGERSIMLTAAELAELEDGTPAPAHRTDPDLAVFFPVVYRDVTGIKLR